MNSYEFYARLAFLLAGDTFAFEPSSVVDFRFGFFCELETAAGALVDASSPPTAFIALARSSRHTQTVFTLSN